MKRLIGYIEPLLFQMKWIFMSPKERYASLWAKTKKLGDFGSAARYAEARLNK
jgi:hypothetical protein